MHNFCYANDANVPNNRLNANYSAHITARE
jgi:hypothetical protein